MGHEASPTALGRRLTAREFADERYGMRLRIQRIPESALEPSRTSFRYSLSQSAWNKEIEAYAPLRFPIDGTKPQLFVTLRREPMRPGDVLPRDVFYEHDLPWGRACCWIDPETWLGDAWTNRPASSTVEALRYAAYGLFEEKPKVNLLNPARVPNLDNIVPHPYPFEYETDPDHLKTLLNERLVRLSRMPGMLAPGQYPESTLESPEQPPAHQVDHEYIQYMAQGDDDEPVSEPAEEEQQRDEEPIDERVVMRRGRGWAQQFESCLAAADHALRYISSAASPVRRASVANDSVERLYARLMLTLDDEGANAPYNDTYGFALQSVEHATANPPVVMLGGAPHKTYAGPCTYVLHRGQTFQREFGTLGLAARFAYNYLFPPPHMSAPITYDMMKNELFITSRGMGEAPYATTGGFYIETRPQEQAF